jgi:hypothetical protein
MSRTLYSTAEFLNNPTHRDVSAISAEIKPGDQGEDYVDFGAILQISDGNNTVNFDFGVYGNLHSERDELRSDLENVRDKARRLRDNIATFVANLEGALVDVQAAIDNEEK